MTLSPDYVRLVLRENFEDAKTLFLRPLLAIHEAHLVMLAETGIVGREDARAIRTALAAVREEEIRHAVFDGSFEDLFFHVERLMAASAGADTAGRLHTARSRNDIDMTMYRMRLVEWLLDLLLAEQGLRRALIDLASAHRDTIFPAQTHGQPAQPTTLAHYLLAVIEMVERDARRLQAAYASVNRCPLGACAITGTGFPIDRDRTAELLGFAGPTENTYGSIAALDSLLESAAAASTLAIGLGRVVHDLLLWATPEFGYLRLGDGLVQISSIMPQKRNPVALEHARALASKAAAELAAVAASVHNTPFGDIVDAEDDLQPLVARAFQDAVRATALIAVSVAGAEFDAARMRERAASQQVSVTEMADALTREHGLPFAKAHDVVSRFVRAPPAPDDGPAARLRRAAQEIGVTIAATDADVARWLDPAAFVAVRRTWGGPAPEQTGPALVRARERLAADEQFAAQCSETLAAAGAARRAALAGL